jgi:2-oxoisovalerate dehydrogenase E1 component beta subunit
MAVMTFIESVRNTLAQEMRRDESIVVLGEDVGKKGGVFGATSGLYAAFGAERVIDTPLAESGIVGTAIGAAVNGLLPVVEIQFADFIFPAMNQIVSEAARLRYRSNGEWGCPIVIRAPFGGGIHGALYHSQSVEAFFAHVPGLKVVVPATPAAAGGLLKGAVRDENPVVFLEHKGSYRRDREEVPPDAPPLALGEARVEREGSTVSVITYGAGVRWAREAAQALQGEGIEVEILDLRTVHPFDREAVARTVARTSRAVIVHEANRTLGVGAEVAAFLAEELFESLDAPLRRVAARDCHVPYAAAQEGAIVPGVADVAAALREVAAY